MFSDGLLGREFESPHLQRVSIGWPFFYYEKYMKRGNTIHLLGINFSSKERNIVDWKEEISLFD